MATVGFVGTGAIAEAICTGLCTGPAAPSSVVLSPRSAARSARLAAAHECCTVAADNQAVVDGAEIIFVCVLPAQLDEALSALTFRPEQTLVSLVSTSTLDGLASCSKLPSSQVFKMICLPPVAMHRRRDQPIAAPPAPATTERAARAHRTRRRITRIRTHVPQRAPCAPTAPKHLRRRQRRLRPSERVE